jgi:hypothetical protein
VRISHYITLTFFSHAAANALSGDNDVGHCAASCNLLENLLHLAVALLSALIQLDQGVANCTNACKKFVMRSIELP